MASRIYRDGMKEVMEDGKSVRRLMVLMLLIMMFMAVALPAFGQEIEPETATGQAINAVATVAFLSLVIQYLIEWVQKQWASLDGNIIRVVAIALGYGAAFAWDLNVAADFGFDGLPVVLAYLVTAFVIAGVSGFLGNAKNVLRAKDPTSSLPPV